jgi:hypothetical protein
MLALPSELLEEVALRMESRSVVRVVVGVMLTALALSPAALAAAPGVSVYRDVTLGSAVQAGEGLGQAALASAPISAAQGRAVRGERLTRRGAAETTGAGAPSAVSNPLATSGGSLPVNFDGVSSRDSELTNFEQEFEPPDQGLCVGNGYVLEMVNSAYTVYGENGKAIAGPFNVNGPFDEGLTEFTSDPRCYYDRSTHTWFATILAINRESTGSTLDIAVNNSGNPSTVWTVYKIDTTGTGGSSGPKEPGCPCFGDQPTLGIDADNLYVTTNEFSIVGEQFDGAQIYAFDKKELVSLSPHIRFAHFGKLAIGGTEASSVQPAFTTGRPGAEYFLSSLNPTGTFDDRVGVWAMTDEKAVGEGSAPTLSSLVITSEPYGEPVKAEQKGAASLIEQDDDRMQQTQFTGHDVWGQLSTSMTIPGESTVRDGAAWFEVKPSVTKELISGASIPHQGYVAVPGNYVLYPALQVAPSGAAAMVMTLTGHKRFASAAYSVLEPEAAAFGPVSIAASGKGPYNEESSRWGDYSWATVSPSGEAIWLATEYVPPTSSQTTDRKGNWGTRVFEVPVG